MSCRRGRAAFFVAASVALGPRSSAQEAAAPAAAERQYRTAQRLGAEGSPDAGAAFEKAVTLAPHGPWADDALVDLARFQGAPDWPEDLAGLDGPRAAAAAATLERVLDQYADGDRIAEARYRRALLRIAPLPGRDAARARQDLIALAVSPSSDTWTVAARYALGILDEISGASDRAAGSFARIIVERPDSPAACRARAGFGRTLLLRGRFGEAAGWFQQAIDSGAPPAVRAGAQRDLALHEVLRQRSPALSWTAVAARLPAIPTTRGAALIASDASGRIVVFDRKSESLQSFDDKGAGSTPETVGEVFALTADPFGRVYVATKDKLLRRDARGITTLASLESFSSPSSIAVDGAGAVWIADRKGERVGRWTPGLPAPQVARESKGAAISALVATGARVIAAEAKTGRLVVVAGPGAETAFGTTVFKRPVALAADAAGRILVLDEKAATVSRLTPMAEPVDTLSLEVGGVSRPLALAAAPDGKLRVLDGATGSVAVAP